MTTRTITVGTLVFNIETDDDGNEKLFLSGALVGEYDAKTNQTRRSPDGEWVPGNHIVALTVRDRFYVYGLVNPKRESEGPFYIGQGTGERAYVHGPEAINNPAENSKKQTRIRETEADGCSFLDMPRTIADCLQKDEALAIESCLLTSVYPDGQLTNIQGGHHADRFRQFGNWDYIQNFDLPIDNEGQFVVRPDEDPPSGQCTHYVYVLLDPADKKVFYVGKGKGVRLQNHFNKAGTVKDDETPGEKLDTIRSLLAQGKVPKDIGRIVAWVESDRIAFWIENLWMKFLIGFQHLTNDQAGMHSIHIRTHGDWQRRHGLDIEGPRGEILYDHYMAEGLDKLLQEVIDRLLFNKPLQAMIQLWQEVTDKVQPNGLLQELIDKLQLNPATLRFSPPDLAGAGEFSRFAPLTVPGGVARLKIHTRFQRTIQVSIVPAGNGQIIWTINHFKKLGAYPLRRADNKFSAKVWENNGLARDADEAAARLLGLIVLARTTDRKAVPAQYAYMLDGLPPARLIRSSGGTLEKGDSQNIQVTLEAYDVYTSETQAENAGERYGVMVKVLRGEEELARCICEGERSRVLFGAALGVCKAEVKKLGYEWTGHAQDSCALVDNCFADAHD